MALIIPNAGEADALAYYVAKQPVDQLVLRLYTNDYTPVAGSTTGSFTEAVGGGYAALVLSGSDWTIVSGAPSLAFCAKQTFTCDGSAGAQVIHGYYLTRENTGAIAHAERFATVPAAFAIAGDKIEITPKISMASVTND
jgi:hypothetical protein